MGTQRGFLAVSARAKLNSLSIDIILSRRPAAATLRMTELA
jgi:hypothetical protein